MSRRTMFAAILAVVIAAPLAKAADSNSSGDSKASVERSDRNRGDRGGDRGNFERSRTERIKERMGASDDEWKVIEPKLQKVNDARRDMFSSMFGGFRGRDSNGGSESRTPMQTASRELRDILENKDATAEQIQAKLTAFREARDKSRAALTAAQKDLKEVLTQRQEAVLVSEGALD